MRDGKWLMFQPRQPLSSVRIIHEPSAIAFDAAAPCSLPSGIFPLPTAYCLLPTAYRLLPDQYASAETGSPPLRVPRDCQTRGWTESLRNWTWPSQKRELTPP